jgi:hypothetical protein
MVWVTKPSDESNLGLEEVGRQVRKVDHVS